MNLISTNNSMSIVGTGGHREKSPVIYYVNVFRSCSLPEQKYVTNQTFVSI